MKMPVLISDEAYKEYRILQNTAIFQQKLDSVRGMVNLKNDIDIPMRKLVAMFALLECSPMWSCCGFDYDRQPMHKTHEYGNTYLALQYTMRTRSILKILVAGKWIRPRSDNTDQWEFWINNGVLYLRSDFDFFHRKNQYPWAMNNCIHFSELAVSKIRELEILTVGYFGDEFRDSVVLKDTNINQKRVVQNWQYPTLEDWTVTLSDVL